MAGYRWKPKGSPMKLTRPFLCFMAVGTATLILSTCRDSRAVPSYSRQTGMPCATCHFTPPELTPFGRKFKLDGYVFRTKPEVTEDKDKKVHDSTLHLLEAFPLSVVFDTSFTSTSSPQPAT